MDFSVRSLIEYTSIFTRKQSSMCLKVNLSVNTNLLSTGAIALVTNSSMLWDTAKTKNSVVLFFFGQCCWTSNSKFVRLKSMVCSLCWSTVVWSFSPLILFAISWYLNSGNILSYYYFDFNILLAKIWKQKSYVNSSISATIISLV